jgi:hypothetical protein
MKKESYHASPKKEGFDKEHRSGFVDIHKSFWEISSILMGSAVARRQVIPDTSPKHHITYSEA